MPRGRRSPVSDLFMALRYGRAPWWLAFAVVVVVLLATWDRGGRDDGAETVDLGDSGQICFVERAVDGDTLLLRGGERVRLLGVDTPESVAPDRPVEPLGPEASAFTKRWVAGREVRLEFDKERRDRHGRLLAYVYVGDDLLNEELIRAGFSRAQTQFPYSNAMKRRFRVAEAEARAACVGLWTPDGRDDGGRGGPVAPLGD
jgi:micrococcal nuclease